MKTSIGQLIRTLVIGYVCTTGIMLLVENSSDWIAHWITQAFFSNQVLSPKSTINETRFYASLLWFVIQLATCEYCLRKRPYWIVQFRWLPMGCMTLTGCVLLQCLIYSRVLHYNILVLYFYVAFTHILCLSYIFRFQKRFMLENTWFDVLLGFTAIWPLLLFHLRLTFLKFLFLQTIAFHLALFLTPLFLIYPLYFPRDRIRRAVWIAIPGASLVFCLLSDSTLMRGLIEGEWSGVPFRWLAHVHYWVIIAITCIPIFLCRMIERFMKSYRTILRSYLLGK